VIEAISAIVLAAGESRRMGESKLLLPWGRTTVLGQVVETIASAGIADILVVTGGYHTQIDELVHLLAKSYPVRVSHNPDYLSGGMLGSIQTGLVSLGPKTTAALVVLGDQPQIQEKTIQAICSVFSRSGATLVFPSFKNRRGHPWLASRICWNDILALPRSTNPREFLNTYSGRIEYIAADETILEDLDTPEDYQRQRP
jgi:molybdenum cofactor cytidylyltransferase